MENKEAQEQDKPIEPASSAQQEENEGQKKVEITPKNVFLKVENHFKKYPSLYAIIPSFLAIGISIWAIISVFEIKGMDNVISILENELDATALNRHPYFVIEDYKDSSSTEKTSSFSNPNSLILKNIGTYAMTVDISILSKRKNVSLTSYSENKYGNRNNCDSKEHFNIIFDNRDFTTDLNTPEDNLSPNQRIDFEVYYEGLNGKRYKQAILIEHDYRYKIYPPIEEKAP